MDETTLKPTNLDSRLNERRQAVVDILYLTQVTWLYVFSLVYPVVGLFYGILLLAASVSPKAKQVGRLCLILGIINAALVILGLIALLVLGLTGVLASLGQD